VPFAAVVKPIVREVITNRMPTRATHGAAAKKE